MMQSKINTISDVEYELIYNTLLSKPVAVSHNKGTGKNYVNFIVDHLITGESTVLHTIELSNNKISSVLQERKAKVLEKALSESKNSNLFMNLQADKDEVVNGLNQAKTYQGKIEGIIGNMYTRLKPEFKGEMMTNFATGMTKLGECGLLSTNAMYYATERMVSADKSFKGIMKNLAKKGKNTADENEQACVL